MFRRGLVLKLEVYISTTVNSFAAYYAYRNHISHLKYFIVNQLKKMFVTLKIKTGKCDGYMHMLYSPFV